MRTSEGPTVITQKDVKSADDLITKLLAAITSKQLEKQGHDQFVGIFQIKPGELIVEVVKPENIPGINDVDPQNILKVAGKIFGKQWNDAQNTLCEVTKQAGDKKKIQLLHEIIRNEVSTCLGHFKVKSKPQTLKIMPSQQDNMIE